MPGRVYRSPVPMHDLAAEASTSTGGIQCQSGSVITWRRASEEDMASQVSSLKNAATTYAEVGSTDGELPNGYRHDRYERLLGQGDKVWSEAKTKVMTWAAHANAEVRVVPSLPPVVSSVVMLTFDVGPAHVLAPCRIVLVADEPARVGFAYGTLAGHPERGEESFMVERREDDTTWFVIIAFSRPADLTTRLAGPVARLIQRRVTNKYLDGLTPS